MSAQHDPTAGPQLGILMRERLVQLHALTSQLAGAPTVDAIVDVVSRHARTMLGADEVTVDVGARDLPTHDERLAIPLRVGERVAGVLALRRADPRWSDDDRTFAELIASATAGALERERLDHELRSVRQVADARLARLRVHLERSPVGTIELDGDRRVVAFSPCAERLFGRRAEEVVGRPARELAWLDPDGALGAPTAALSADASTTLVTRHPTGEHELVCEWHVSSLLDDASAVDGIVALALDVSRREAVSALVADANRRAQELVDVIGHELRNPLAAIGAAVAVLTHADRPDTPRHEARAREIIAGQTKHLARMIDGLLDVARAQQRQLRFEGEPVDLAQLVREAVDARRTDAVLADIQLVLRGADAPVPALAMPARLTQALGALIENAIKFGRRGGWVEVELRERDERLVVVVRDDGIGMSPALLATAFDPLVQGVALRDRGPINGLGLGLTLAREIARLHGGDIEARSGGPGRGSTFELRLPRPAVDAPDTARGPAPTRRVLVVDDGEDTLEMMQELLESWGHEVHVASTGALAVDVARHQRPEIVLCDLGLPGELDGYDVARALRADPLVGSAYLVALTGYDGSEARARARAAGFDTLVAKPAPPERLRALIDQLERD